METPPFLYYALQTPKRHAENTQHGAASGHALGRYRPLLWNRQDLPIILARLAGYLHTPPPPGDGLRLTVSQFLCQARCRSAPSSRQGGIIQARHGRATDLTRGTRAGGGGCAARRRAVNMRTLDRDCCRRVLSSARRAFARDYYSSRHHSIAGRHSEGSAGKNTIAHILLGTYPALLVLFTAILTTTHTSAMATSADHLALLT